MKFNVNQQDLQKSLNYCQGVIEKRSTLPILSNVLLDASNSKLTITATDLDMIFIHSINNVEIIEEGKTTTTSSIMYDIIRKFSSGKKINLLSSNFIQKNPNQLKKKIYSSNKSHDGLVVVYHYNKFSEVAKKIMQTEKQSKTYILGRYNLNYYDEQLKKNLSESDIITKEEVEKVLEKSKNFEYKTIHKSKGLEADNVIIINMFSGTNGFPSQKENDELLALVLPNLEEFEFAEERRLMYVAMTRAKKRIYMFTGESIFAVSDFIEEIKKDYPKLINTFRKKKK